MAESDSTSLVDQKEQWSNDKTIIELGYRKISWFASVSKIDLLVTDKSQYFAQPRSIIVYVTVPDYR